jgi:hypothetical protein
MTRVSGKLIRQRFDQLHRAPFREALHFRANRGVVDCLREFVAEVPEV